jgi:hypothetical protein
MCFVRISEQTATFALETGFVKPKWRVFTARYALSPYIKQTNFAFKGLIRGRYALKLLLGHRTDRTGHFNRCEARITPLKLFLPTVLRLETKFEGLLV